MQARKKALLFDLGGVLVKIDFALAFASWENFSDLDRGQIQQRFSMDECYQQHEIGKVGWQEYAGHLRDTLELRGTLEQIARGWNAIFEEELVEVVEAVRNIKGQVHCSILSNSNPTHKQFWVDRYSDVIALFDDVFVSSDIGYRKPDLECFNFVSDAMGYPLHDIVFFDDTLENVTMANEAGLEAVHVRGEDDVFEKLAQLGYI